jgi:hypothetical protein
MGWLNRRLYTLASDLRADQSAAEQHNGPAGGLGGGGRPEAAAGLWRIFTAIWAIPYYWVDRAEFIIETTEHQPFPHVGSRFAREV